MYESKSVTYHIFAPSVSNIDGGIPAIAYYMADFFGYNNSDEEAGQVICYSVLDSDVPIPGVIMHYPGTTNNIKKTLANRKLFLKHFKENKGKGSRQIAICLSWRYALVPYFFGRRKCRYIVLAHGNELLNRKASSVKSVKDKAESLLRKKILKNAVRVVANSEYTANLVKNNCGRENVEIIHPCIRVSKCADENNYNKTEKMTVFSLGRLEERKGYEDMLTAVAELRNEYPDIKYIIAGKGPFENAIREKIKKLKLEDCCELKGRITEDEKKDLFERCTVFAMPSFYMENERSVEGFGMVYLEANSYGKPVIACDTGGVGDAVKNKKTGILIKERDTEALKDALSDILSGRCTFDRSEMMNWADEHSVQAIMNKYKAMVEEVLF